MERFAKRYGLFFLLGGIIGMASVYCLVIPVCQEMVGRVAGSAGGSGRTSDAVPLSHDIMFRVSRFFAALWVFVLGTCVGSFLNVVIYRVPQGISVLIKGSYCPQCREPIRPQDNVPLLGWLRLQGQCYNCGLEISSRYPIVELAIGLLFLLLFFVELVSGGANLPVRPVNRLTGVQWTVFEPQWELFALYSYHCFLLCSLFAWAMIRRDGHLVPKKAVVIVLAMAVGAPIFLPSLLPWPWWRGTVELLPHASLTAGWTSILGILCGFVAAEILSVKRLPTDQDADVSHIPSWLLIGAGLGWQAVVGIFVLVFAWGVTRKLFNRMSAHNETSMVDDDPELLTETGNAVEPVYRHFALLTATLGHHLMWRQIASVFVEF